MNKKTTVHGLGLLLLGTLAACGGGSDEAAGDTSTQGQRARPLAVAAPAQARWDPLVRLPLVPAAAANLPDGKVLLWSAEEKFSFGAATGRTYFATYDPATGRVTERTVTETGHNMFCPGTTNLADGRLLVNGGISAAQTSIFDPATGVWSTAARMSIPRGYQANTLLRDGSVLTLGGSWSGGVGNKHGEVWSAASGWRRITGVPIEPFLSPDPSRNFGGDSHFWLIPAGNGRVFHAGPGVNMHWIDTEGEGRVVAAGPRGDDEFSISGTTVMYDAGRVLKTGGGPGYDSVQANANTYVIELDGAARVRKVAPMAYRRAFHNSVVLPNGQVLVVGGQTYAVGFSDNNSVLVPELWDPRTETFTTLPPIAAPRNYHSVALLLPDARVVVAGGGLCGAGCAANHPDLQVLTPHYLLNRDGTPAARPAITEAPGSVRYGQTVAVATDRAVASFAIVRLSSTTHTVNNDQRRLSLSFTASGSNRYDVRIPTNPGLALPGDWMLFALDAEGTPSVARIVRIGLDGAASIRPIDDPNSAIGTAAQLQPAVTPFNGESLRYEADGLPPGITLDATTGRMQGQPAEPGSHRVTLRAIGARATTSIDFVWTVSNPGSTRFVRLEALSEVNGNAWASAAEIQLLGGDGQPLPRTGWVASASSQETAGENGVAGNAIDGNPATMWHTQWQAASPRPPHTLTIDLGSAREVTGLRYLPRQDASVNGTIAGYRIFLSADGVNWGPAVASGNLTELGAAKAERVVLFNNVARGRVATQSSTLQAGAGADRAVDGNVNGTFSSGSVSHTNTEANPWWEVDLGTSHALTAVRLWNRTDCCADRLVNVELLVSDTPMAGRTRAQLLADPAVWRASRSGVAPRSLLLDTPGARGRFVRVQLAGTGILQLAEVEVHGRVASNRAPQLQSPADQSAEQGRAVSLRIGASDPDGDTLRFSAAGLPPGLSLDAASGTISGAPTAEGRFEVTVGVDDGRGGSNAVKFFWTVLSAVAELLPVEAPPVAAGSTVNFSAATGNGGSYGYRWDFGDGSAATEWSSLPTASHTYASPGVYYVTVTARTTDGRSSSRSFWQAVQGPGGAVGRATSALAVEPRGTNPARLWAVNPDNDSVSVFDTTMRSRVAEIALGSGSQPRTVAVAPDGRIWVANKGSATLGIVSPATLAVVQTVALPRASQPYGIVFAADGSALVALEATGEVLRVSAAGVPGTRVAVGPNVRHMALDATRGQLLVTRFITPPQPGEATARVADNVAGAPRGGEMLVLDATTLALQRTVVLRHSQRADNTIQGRGVPNYLGAPALSPDGTTAWVPGKQDNIARGRLRDGQDLDFQNTVRAISSRIDLASGSENPDHRVDHDNAGVASAALFHPGGAYLFVALETNRQVAVLDAAGRRELFRVDVGRAPQALALAADGRTLYVQNFMDRSVSVLDLGPLLRFGDSRLPVLATMASVASERLPAAVLAGKQLFYDARDPRLARDSYISCASCHHDGGHDGRTWDFTGFGEGLRNTIGLRGRAGAQGRLHWSGNFDEVQDFEAQIRTLAQGTGLMRDADFNSGTRNTPLGTAKAGVSADLDALAAYVASLSTFDPSPHRQADGSLSAAAAAGRTVFAAQCIACHGGSGFTDSASGLLRNVGTLKPSSGQRLGAALTGIDPPTLRDAWATAPYLHDGSAATIEAAIGAHTNLALNATDLANVAAFVRQIGREEPAVAPPLPTSGGLLAQYFANTTLGGSPVLTRVENPSFDWGTGSPGPGVPTDNFSVRWSGSFVAPATGTYRFRTRSDDGVRLWVGGTQRINNWTDHSPTLDTSSGISLVAGQRYTIVLEYYERGGGGVLQLTWQRPGSLSYVALPGTALSPP